MSIYILPKLMSMSLTASIVIICVLIIRLFLKKAPKVISYALWSVVLFRLLCPISITSEISLFGLLDMPAAEVSKNTSSMEYFASDTILSTGDAKAAANHAVSENTAAIPNMDKVNENTTSKDGDSSGANVVIGENATLVPEITADRIINIAEPDILIKDDSTKDDSTKDGAVTDDTETDDIATNETTITDAVQSDVVKSDFTEASPTDMVTIPKSKLLSREKIVLAGTILWLVGLVAMSVYAVYTYLQLKKRLLTAVPLRDNIYLADAITSPFVLGLIRPRIYLPSYIEEKEQGYILLHEQHHIRRGDHVIKFAAFLALSLHWFNPLVWVAFVYANKDMEMSCDEAVIKKLGAEVLADYSLSLLSLATGKRMINGMPLAFGEGDTKGRIMNLAKWKKPAIRVSFLAVTACVILSVVLLTNPSGTEDKDNIPDNVPSNDTNDLQIESGMNPEITETVNPTEETTNPNSEYQLIYKGIDIFKGLSEESYLKYTDNQADLYTRQLKDAIELSLWSGDMELWRTQDSQLVNSDFMKNEYALFWQKDSANLDLEQKMSYYLVPIDDTIYLMRYLVETSENKATMSYKVFGIESSLGSPYYAMGNEVPYDAGSVSCYLVTDSLVDTQISFPIEELTVFAENVKKYMENGYLIASTLQGEFALADSKDKNSSLLAYLYDIFPWIPEIVNKNAIPTENIYFAKQMLTEVQKVLPSDTNVHMPDVAEDGSYFITGNYYSSNDTSYLTVDMQEDGSYQVSLLIDNALKAEFVGEYENSILTAVQSDYYPEETPYELEISFQNGIATLTITAVSEYSIVETGDTYTLDRQEKPYAFRYLKNVEGYSLPNKETKEVPQPDFRNILSDMEEQYIFYYDNSFIIRRNINTGVRELIHIAENKIVGIKVFEDWIYFIEYIEDGGRSSYCLSKVDISGIHYEVIQENSAPMLDISNNILFTRAYITDAGTEDTLYELKLENNTITEIPIEAEEITLVEQNTVVPTSSNDNKRVLLGETVIYEVEGAEDEIFIKSFSDNYVVLDLAKNNLSGENIVHQTLVVSLSTCTVIMELDVEMQYVDILNHWIVYLDKADGRMHFEDIFAYTAGAPEPRKLHVFEKEDVAVIPAVSEPSFEEACRLGEVQNVEGGLPGLAWGTWYIIEIEGVKYFYAQSDGVERVDYYGYAIVDDNYSLANGITIGTAWKELLEKYPNMAMEDFEGNSLLEIGVTSSMGWNGIAYPESFIDQFDYVMFANIDTTTEDGLPIYVGLLMKNEAVAAITFYWPTAG